MLSFSHHLPFLSYPDHTGATWKYNFPEIVHFWKMFDFGHFIQFQSVYNSLSMDFGS